MGDWKLEIDHSSEDEVVSEVKLDRLTSSSP